MKVNILFTVFWSVVSGTRYCESIVERRSPLAEKGQAMISSLQTFKSPLSLGVKASGSLSRQSSGAKETSLLEPGLRNDTFAGTDVFTGFSTSPISSSPKTLSQLKLHNLNSKGLNSGSDRQTGSAEIKRHLTSVGGGLGENRVLLENSQGTLFIEDAAPNLCLDTAQPSPLEAGIVGKSFSGIGGAGFLGQCFSGTSEAGFLGAGFIALSGPRVVGG